MDMSMEMEKLSMVLWRERKLLETLQYRLEVEQLVMAGGRTGWLTNAARDVESVLEEIRGTEVLRAVAADEAAAALGLPTNPSLADLIGAVDEPWRTILEDHRAAFVATNEELSRLAETNRSLITAGFKAAREALVGLSTDDVRTYAPDGTAVPVAAGAGRVDRSL
jgi:hypothetical protein